MVFHLAGEVVDAAGKPIAGPVEWNVTVTSGRHTAVLHLTSARAELNVQRPFAYRLDRGDSLVVAAQVPGIADARVQVTVGFEMGERAASRIAVRPVAVAADAPEDDEVAARGAPLSWIWTADAPGRLVAMHAPQMAGATAVIVEDATTGEVIWRADGPPRLVGAAQPLRETQLPGIVLSPGRTYRIRVERAAGTATTVVAPIVMLVPRVSLAR